MSKQTVETSSGIVFHIDVDDGRELGACKWEFPNVEAPVSQSSSGQAASEVPKG
jgi:hypothetical protein